MTSKFCLFLLPAFLMTLSGRSVLGITCYKCDSDEPDFEPFCRDPYTGSGNTCDGEVCVKAKAELKALKISEVARGCLSEAEIGYKADGCTEDSNNGAYAAVCVCRTNHCNTGSTITSPIIASLLVATAIIFMF